MNNLKIAYDGRVTAWNSKTFTPNKSFKRPSLNPELGAIYFNLPPEGKAKFLDSLGSSHVTISEKEEKTPNRRAIRGSKGITALGRSRVRCGAQWLEDRVGIKHLTFLTCTLPPAALTAYTREKWAEVVHRFRKWLTYHLEQANLCSLSVVVTEIQTLRWEEEQGQPPVHLHCLFHGRQVGKGWAYPPEFYQVGWQQVCESVLACRSDWSASTRVESLRSSSVSYLGKYMSKGMGQAQKCPPELLPSSWYSISDRLRKICNAHTVKVFGALAVAYVKDMQAGNYMLWSRDIVQNDPETDHEWYMGWTGAIRGRQKYLQIVEDIRDAIWAEPGVRLTACVTL